MASSGYTAITFVADQLLTSTVMNQMAANDAAFNNGNGFEDSILLTRHFANLQILSKHMKPSYGYTAGSTGGARQSIGTSWTAVQGATRSYTSGPTAEVLFIFGTCIANATAAGSQFLIGQGTTPLGKSDYDDQSGTFKGRMGFLIYEIAANTTLTFGLLGKAASGTVAVGNAAADVTVNYSPHIGIIAFGR